MGWIDSHIHLNCLPEIPELYKHIPSVVPGVRGKDLRSIQKQLPLTRICSGIHPLFIHESIPLNELRNLIERVKPVAIGECGLDRREKDINLQLEYFEHQILLAQELHLPLVIHLVGHLDLFLSLLKKYRFKAYIHFFGLKSVPTILLEEDIYFGFCSRLTPASKAYSLFKDLPIDKILIETDGDDEFPPEENELADTYQRLADLRSMSVEQLADQIQRNHQAFYQISL